MRKISNLRDALAGIDGALVDIPPKEGSGGDEPSQTDARVLWHGEAGAETFAEVLVPSSEDEDWTQQEFDFEPVFRLAPQVDDGLPKLGADQERRIAREVLLCGVDALGWYSSYHVKGVQWGAYVKVSGLLYLAQKAFAALDLPAIVKIQLAFRTILDHELFHFATDYAVGQAELAQAAAWWAPFKNGKRPTYPLEEKLANAYMLRRGRAGPKVLQVRGKQEALRCFMKQQPEGYRDGWKVGRNDWPDELAKLAAQYGALWAADHDPEGKLFGSAYDWEAQFPIHPMVDGRHCPIHLVDDSKRYGLPEGWLDAFSRVEYVTETQSFKKQLGNLSDVVQKAWERTKAKMAVALTAGSDFKLWPPGGHGVYSCRVGSNFRAHLRYDRTDDRWEAIAIGSHRAMGHG